MKIQSSFPLALLLSIFFSSATKAEVSATLKCKIQWNPSSEAVELKEALDCAESCKIQAQGPDGISFSGESNSATRVKLVVSSLTKNESLIFVKDFEFSQIVGQCSDTEILKEDAKGFCTLCVKN